MFNKKNILGWISLALRLILSFGLIFVVSKFIGNDSVGLWIVYITIIATINSIDGLLSQFFIREIISCAWNNDSNVKNCQYYSQYVLYAAIALCIYFTGYFTLKMDEELLIVISCLLSLYLMARVYDSRFRAHLDAGLVQKIEIILNLFLMVLVAAAIAFTKNIGLFIAVHLMGLIFLLIAKFCIVRKSEGHVRYLSNSAQLLKKLTIDEEIIKTLIISFGSGLSINLSLVAMEAMIPGGISTNFIFTYRVGSLICEIISIPVIIRIPQLTKLIASGNKTAARLSFTQNYRQSIVFCIAFMSIVFLMQGIWNDYAPQKLNLVNRLVLVGIFGGWLFERVATLLSQFYLSSKAYSIYKYYIGYTIFISISVAVSVLYRNEHFFAYSVSIINLFVAILMLRKWRSGYAI